MDSGGGRFDGIDPNLTVFALANGLDLAKGEEFRRLEWFSEGLERGILIEADEADGFRVHVMTWRSGKPDLRTEASVANGLPAEGVRAALPDAIETANGLVAPGTEPPSDGG